MVKWGFTYRVRGQAGVLFRPLWLTGEPGAWHGFISYDPNFDPLLRIPRIMYESEMEQEPLEDYRKRTEL